MKLQITKFIQLILAILILTGCSFNEVVVEDVQSVQITHLQGGKLGMKVYIPICNPNNIRFKVTGVDIHIKLNKIEVGKITNYQDVKIQKNSREVYAFPVDMQLSGFLKGALALLSMSGKDDIRIAIDGTLEIKYLLGKKIIQVQSEGEVIID